MFVSFHLVGQFKIQLLFHFLFMSVNCEVAWNATILAELSPCLVVPSKPISKPYEMPIWNASNKNKSQHFPFHFLLFKEEETEETLFWQQNQSCFVSSWKFREQQTLGQRVTYCCTGYKEWIWNLSMGWKIFESSKYLLIAIKLKVFILKLILINIEQVRKCQPDKPNYLIPSPYVEYRN